MNRYEKYKSTNIEWIGDIPEHWEVKKLKYIGEHFTGATPQSTNPNFWSGEVKWITPEDLSAPKNIYLSD